MPTGASLKGVQQFWAKVQRVQKAMGDEAARGLFQETQVEATEVKKRTPVDKGTLRGTVHVVGPVREGRKIYTLIACGGPSAPYAVFVHEDLEAFHKVGQAKFLESVIMESRPFMASRVAKRMELNRALVG